MQGTTLIRRKGGIFCPSSVLVLLILPLSDLPPANGSCEFPSGWVGEWYQYEKSRIVINATILGERTCIQKAGNMYITYGDGCYHCMIINDHHTNVIQYREGWCASEYTSLDDMCFKVRPDEPLYSMFRLNSRPIPCPFIGPSFTFTYDKGHGECSRPVSSAERCTDESKLFLKYQACPDIDGTESHTEELQCLAVWNEGHNKYLAGTLKGRTALGSEKETYRCFLYEERTHHQGKVVYLLAQSGDPTCSGLTTVSEGSTTIRLTKVDKEHNRCKYPSWVTEHHDWHSLDGTKVYHFTNKNATLKVKVQEGDGDVLHEEKIVCHNLEEMYPKDNMQGHKVKLVAHVTSGCDIGYVCMIFHRRDSHVVELQQSNQKAVIPSEACDLWDPSAMPYTTLITSSLRERKCPNPGRYAISNLGSFASSGTPKGLRRDDKSGSNDNTNDSRRTAKRRIWREDTDDDIDTNTNTNTNADSDIGAEEKLFRCTDVQVGCSSAEQSEMTIGNTCDGEEAAYFCHGSWEERGTWYTIVSQKTGQTVTGLGQTFCFSMHFTSVTEKPLGRPSKTKSMEQELWLSRPGHACRMESSEWPSVYRLVSQGVCEDLTKAASSLASVFALSRILFIFSVGMCTLYKLLLR